MSVSVAVELQLLVLVIVSVSDLFFIIRLGYIDICRVDRDDGEVLFLRRIRRRLGVALTSVAVVRCFSIHDIRGNCLFYMRSLYLEVYFAVVLGLCVDCSCVILVVVLVIVARQNFMVCGRWCWCV